MSDRKWEELSEKQRALVTIEIKRSFTRLMSIHGGPDMPGYLSRNEKLEAYQVAAATLGDPISKEDDSK